VFALIANEFANGQIAARPWAAPLNRIDFLHTLATSFANVPYLLFRAIKAGADQRPIIRSLAYLLLIALDRLPTDAVVKSIKTSLTDHHEKPLPKSAQETLLLPILNQLRYEIGDVCSSDCHRLFGSEPTTLAGTGDEIDQYWLRLERDGGIDSSEERRFLRIEKFDAPCKVGFALDKDHCCPLFEGETDLDQLPELLLALKRVVDFRKKQAAAERTKAKTRGVRKGTGAA
jgi:hypothetical protein